MKIKSVFLSLLLLVLICSIYWIMPVFNYGFWGWSIYLMCLTLAVFIERIIIIVPKNETYIVQFNSKPKGIKPIFAVLVVLATYAFVVPFITSWKLFRATEYQHLIGAVKKGEDFSTHLTPISIKKIRTVDEELARILGDKVLGGQPALGSQVTLGEFTIQKVKDELYWIAPLLHSGFFKWNKNKQGTNGYVMVNATNERDVKLVQEINGKKIRIKFQPNAFFQDNLKRHIYFNGYLTKGLTDYTFEIDDKGIPYWVITIYQKKIGFYGSDATGILTVNAENGQIKEYGLNAIPTWIDRVQPENFIKDQLTDWGELIHGYWNFSNEGKLQPTEDLTLVYGEDNKSYWYTGLTSVGADEATVGFILIDTRTKKAVWYKQGGATEFAAMGSATGKVQEKGYTATIPTPYNINNIPTYVMTLKDDGGLVKMYAMVSIQDYTIVGVGNSLQETLMAYKNALNSYGNKINSSSKTEKIKLHSKITRINSDIKNGNSFYYLQLEGSSKLFIGSSQISNELPISLIGDSVTIEFDADSDQLIGITNFDNKNIQ